MRRKKVKNKKIVIEKHHILDKCVGCGIMVRCGTCGNNSCNASYGEVDGKTCTDCPRAYEVQDMYWKNPGLVIFEKSNLK